MYLARRFRDNKVLYFLRESYLDGEIYRNRDLLELGGNPGKFIVYPGGASFYIDELIIEQLQQVTGAVDYDTVESLFLPFLDPVIRARLDDFSGRGQGGRNWKPPDKKEREFILAHTHIFDRRRLHFLRFGQVDQRALDRSPSLFRSLLHKSRDELEQCILEQEQGLSSSEYKSYIFTVFDLQRHFNGAFARAMPYALNDNQLDEYFLKELCALDQDHLFWQGLERGKGLPLYLIRYVIMFFDYSFPQTQAEQGFGPGSPHSSFGGQYQQARPHRPSPMAEQEAAGIFGVDQAALDAMSKAELTKLYRKKAHDLHPDKGGEHDEFIALTTAYNELLKKKSH
jgi:hypothetical protein